MSVATQKLQSLIGGELRDAGEPHPVVNPATAETIGAMPIAADSDVDDAVAAAHAAFPGWSTTVPAERSSALLALADLIDEHAQELAVLEAVDAGKPIATVVADEVPWWSDILRFHAGAARCLGGSNTGEYVANHTSSIRREPVGVVGQITPWNYPLVSALLKFAPALATGNTVVLKPAENTPFSTARLAELCVEHEVFPAGVFNIVLGTGELTGAHLMEHPDVDMVSLTGSVETGRWVAETAGRGLKRAILELGGNAPVLVFDDADIDAAASTLTETGFYNAGQECLAPARILASAKVYDEFVSKLAENARAVAVGDTLDEGTALGPLISQDQRTRVQDLLDRAGSGAELVTGGNAPDGAGYYLEPTIVANLEPQADIVQQEIFGPVLTVQRFTDEREALALANDTRYGLAAGVWTRDHGRATRVASQLDFGTVWINSYLVMATEMPHGGFKDSGFGKEMGTYALDEYLRTKHVMSSWD